ncbi:MAG: DUF3302 domain-containing protein [Tepidisphaera sp.]
MLEYLALGMLLLSVVAVFYIFIFIHDIPHRIARSRHHPHEEAIHYACWLSLFTLHALWPIVFIWAVSHKKDGNPLAPPGTGPDLHAELASLKASLAALESKVSSEGKGV